MRCSNIIVPGMAETSKIKNPGLEMKMDKEFVKEEKIEFDLSASRKTQVKNTIGTYRKVMSRFFKGVDSSDIIDYGAGYGVGTREFNLDSYEPFPERGAKEYGWQPDYTNASDISKQYKGLISNAVLNVIPNTNGERNAAVRGIGAALAPGGKGFVAARDRSFLKDLKNPKPYGDGVITGSGSFQKGFTQKELVDYIQSTLGPGFTVQPSGISTSGAVSVIITRL
jgi:hypothetical protein